MKNNILQNSIEHQIMKEKKIYDQTINRYSKGIKKEGNELTKRPLYKRKKSQV